MERKQNVFVYSSSIHFHNVSDDDSVFRKNASINCNTNMYIDSGSSLDHNFESFQYTDYSICDYNNDLDPLQPGIAIIQMLCA